MPDVKIKGYSGNELEYQDVEKIYLAAPESTPEQPVLVPFTPGELLEGVEVEPDFSAGDMTVTVPEGYLVKSAVVKKPETLVPENIAKDVLVAGILGTHEGGSDDVRYVTFMYDDGTVEYGKKAVATGDDCADPIARGIFDTPTKESTDQYSYTFGGWAMTPGGGIDSNALKAVTEDRTVYANFISAVRYYTITYFDNDGVTVLKTESLAYGATPSYSPEKDGYKFNGWTPSTVTVTGNTSYTANWEKLSGLQFVSKATDVISIRDIAASTLAVKNSGTHVIAIDNSVTSTDYFMYNMTSQEAVAETVTTTQSTDRGKGALNHSDDILFSRNYTNLIIDTFGGSTTVESVNNIRALATSPSSNLLAYVRVYSNSDTWLQLRGNGNPVIKLGYYFDGYIGISKNDEYIVLANGSYSDEKGIRIYSLDDQTLVKNISSNASAKHLSISADGKYFAVSWDASPYVSVYSLETFEQVCTVSGIITSTSFAAFVGDILVVATDSNVRAFTIANGAPEEYFEIPTYSGGSITKIATSLNGKHIAFYDQSSIEMWSKV